MLATDRKDSTTCYIEDVKDEIHNLPKIELHAHLNGCVRLSHLCDLVDPTTLPDPSKMRDLPTGFAFMASVSALTRDTAILRVVVDRVLKDFEKDGVVYLELKSGPKSSDKISKREYIECIIGAMKAHKGSLIPRYTISIDQSKSLEDMIENAQLAIEYNNTSDICVGVDISGDVFKATKDNSLRVLKMCKDAGLKISCHIAEDLESGISSHTADLLRQILPDRLGHATMIAVDSEDGEFVRRNRIPIECCMTSNVFCKTVQSYKEHHFKTWWDLGHPVLLCTDDSGTFNTTLSREYQMAVESFGFTVENLKAMNKAAVEWVFDDNVKEKLRKIF